MTTSIFADYWRTPDEALPDIAPGRDSEYVVKTQNFCVLHQVHVVQVAQEDMVLVRLDIGTAQGVPFELDQENAESNVRVYRLKDLEDADLKDRLVKTGAAVATKNTIAIGPFLEIRTVLRNQGASIAKHRVAFLGQEEKGAVP
jgi:hypothetical protein